MIQRKNKRKWQRVHNDNDEEPSDNNKYLAYVERKTNSKQKAKEREASLTVCSGSSEILIVKNVKREKKIENKVDNSKVVCNTDDEITSKVGVIISAKPKLNKNAINVQGANNKFCTKNKNKFKKHVKQGDYDYAAKNFEGQIITPGEELMPNIHNLLKFDGPSTSKSLDVRNSRPLNQLPPLIICGKNGTYEPMIVEAHLKKSWRSYTPKCLLDSEGSINNDNETDKLKDNKSTNTKFTMNKHEMPNIMASTNNPVEPTPNSNCDIPKALQEFYNEVQNSFEPARDETTKMNKKAGNKSALTVDKSVKSFNNLKDIVRKNTVDLDTSSKNQEKILYFFSLESKVILVLCPETQLSFLGKLKLQVLYGAVQLYGCTFNPGNTVKPVEIYSPKGYSSVTISSIEQSNTYNKEVLWDALTSEGVDRSLKTKLHDVISECKYGWSVLLMENFENTLSQFLNHHCPSKLFPKIDNVKYLWCDPRRAECIMQANFQFANFGNEISICPQWNENVTKQLVDQWILMKSLRVMVAGGKGVGKSTTARYLINNLLKTTEKVVLLDLDPGQAEFTPAACLSLNVIDQPLLGPNFTHVKTPFYQLYLEDINVANCLCRYIECAKKLVECLKNRKELAQYPVIVNTMGFCKGLGLDICVFLIKLIEPNNIVQIRSSKPKNNFDFDLRKDIINKKKRLSISFGNDYKLLNKICDYNLHHVPSMAEGKRQFETWNLEPRQQRDIVLLSYLSKIIENADDKSFCNFTSNSINNIVPYVLPFSSFYVSLIKSNTSPTHILAAMNGNIVALCGIDLEESSTVDRESLNYPLVVIKPPACTCYGYGIVRGVDMKRRCVYINTPLSQSQLRYVNLLAGSMAVPFSLLRSTERSSAPYAADRGELPTSREAKRGYFRADQNKSI